MSTVTEKVSRGPMIHVRLDDELHRLLKIMVAQRATTIQQLVKDIIQREIDGSNESVKLEME